MIDEGETSGWKLVWDVPHRTRSPPFMIGEESELFNRWDGCLIRIQPRLRRVTYSTEQLGNHFSVGNQRDRSSDTTHVLVVGIDSQGREYRAEEIGDLDGAVGDLIAVGGGRSNDLTAADSAPRDRSREGSREMVTTRTRIDARGSAKLSEA